MKVVVNRTVRSTVENGNFHVVLFWPWPHHNDWNPAVKSPIKCTLGTDTKCSFAGLSGVKNTPKTLTQSFPSAWQTPWCFLAPHKDLSAADSLSKTKDQINAALAGPVPCFYWCKNKGRPGGAVEMRNATPHMQQGFFLLKKYLFFERALRNHLF